MSLLTELKRRNVFRVAIAYAALAWLMAQVAALLLQTFAAPDWVLKSIIALFVVGFPFAVFFAWAYELTPEGIKPEREVAEAASVTEHTGRRLDRAIIVLLVLALAAYAWDRFAPPRSELAGTPAAETPALAETVPEGAPLIPSGPPKESIAVLPFANMSEDAGNEYFSDGISEEILNLLAKLPGLHVTSRSSSFQFKGDDIHIPTVAEQLGVAHVLEGSVRKAGNRVRITAQLIDAGADRHLWSQTWDRELTDIFAIQDEIAAAVVGALEESLLGIGSPADVEIPPRTDAQTYELYLRGRHLTWLREPGPLAEAERLFQQAIEIDPEYAPAYAGLATALIFHANSGQTDAPAAYAQAEVAIERALALDPENSEAYAALGLLRNVAGRYEEARDALHRAVALNPNDAQAYYWLSLQYYYSDPIKALELVQRAYAINPLTRVVVAGLAWRLDPLGRYEEAMTLVRKYLDLFQDDNWAFRAAADLHTHQGRLDAALKTQYRQYRARPERGFGFITVPILFLLLGEEDLAAAWLAELQQAMPMTTQVILPHVLISATRGELPLAIKAAQEAAAGTDNLWLDQALAVAYLFAGDANSARRVFEQAQPNVTRDPPEWDPEYWVMMSNYAAALLKTGSADRAAALLQEIATLLERQVAQGVIWGPRGTLLEELAMIRSMQGRPEEALDFLQTAARQISVLCVHCLNIFFHYENVRDEPGFEALVADQEAKVGAQRQRLADEGMLLTPEQVLALENFEFDPLAQ